MTPLRIIVVDDHPLVRRGARAILESQPGWEVSAEAATGRQAVELVRRLRPDVVVMDISLPELNGVEATRQIVKDSPRTEVLVFTVHQSEQLVREVLSAGARGYALKSDADRTLIAAVESVRQHRPFLAPAVTGIVLDGYMHRSGALDDDRAEAAKVTPREREVLQLIAEGNSSKEIASALNLSVKTIDAHRANIMRKLHLHSVSHLVRYAIRHRIVEP
jgi:DNA-binding NarL/FixJ family response regulator